MSDEPIHPQPACGFPQPCGERCTRPVTKAYVIEAVDRHLGDLTPVPMALLLCQEMADLVDSAEAR